LPSVGCFDPQLIPQRWWHLDAQSRAPLAAISGMTFAACAGAPANHASASFSKAPSLLARQASHEGAHGFGVERPREFAVTSDARHDGFCVVSCQCHVMVSSGGTGKMRSAARVLRLRKALRKCVSTMCCAGTVSGHDSVRNLCGKTPRYALQIIRLPGCFGTRKQEAGAPPPEQHCLSPIFETVKPAFLVSRTRRGVWTMPTIHPGWPHPPTTPSSPAKARTITV
jgi:hypothetical protein